MYKIEDFKRDIEQLHAEVIFSFKGETYIISENIGEGENGEKLCISGPEETQYVNTTDEALDKLIVDGLPMRERMDAIQPY